jgi:hypothetical protein
MSEENVAPEGNEQQEEFVEAVLTPTEQEALDAGWVPEDAFQGDKEKWVNAAEFLRRGELFQRIESQGRELKETRKALQAMSKLHTDIREVEYKRAMETIRAQKKAALEEGDADAVIAADERLDLVREEQRLLKQEQVREEPHQAEEHPEFVQWKSKNNWYVSSTPMRAFADALGLELRSEGLSPSAVLRRVEQEVRKEFPNKFQNPNQSRSSSVEGGVRRGGKSDSFQLTPLERKMMGSIVRTGALTEEAYIAEIKKNREV